MSRVSYNDTGGDWNWIMWAGRAKMAIQGKRGRKALSKLRDDLMRMSDKRLIESSLCDGSGICIVGVGGYRHFVDDLGMTPRDAWRRLRKIARRVPYTKWASAFGLPGGWAPTDVDAEDVTVEFAENELGLTPTLVWELMEKNDERFGRATPEQRYMVMLKWIDEVLAAPPLRRKAA